jgi:hypothetical protein
MKRVVLIIGAFLFAAAFLWSQTRMTKQKLLDMPYAKVKAMLSNPHSARELKAAAKKDGVMVMGGTPISGPEVTLKGELTGADCYLSAGIRGHEHALCAKACVAHGGPVVFIGQNGTTYLALPAKDGIPLPQKAYNDLGKPGVTVKAAELDSHGIHALAIQSVED